MNNRSLQLAFEPFAKFAKRNNIYYIFFARLPDDDKFGVSCKRGTPAELTRLTKTFIKNAKLDIKVESDNTNKITIHDLENLVGHYRNILRNAFDKLDADQRAFVIRELTNLIDNLQNK